MGKLVIKALDDEQHPLAAQLQELRKWIDLNRANAAHPSTTQQHSPSQEEPKWVVMSEKHFFMPQPGISLPIQPLWPLQLLLHEAALSSSGEALAFRLDIGPQEIGHLVKQAEESSIDYGSVLQYGNFLHTALAHLDYPEPPFRLDGRNLVYGGQEVRLSQQQTAFVQLLIDNSGEWVSHQRFAERGIRNPAKIFYTLKGRVEGITGIIHSKAGAYQFVDHV